MLRQDRVSSAQVLPEPGQSVELPGFVLLPAMLPILFKDWCAGYSLEQYTYFRRRYWLAGATKLLLEIVLGNRSSRPQGSVKRCSTRFRYAGCVQAHSLPASFKRVAHRAAISAHAMRGVALAVQRSQNRVRSFTRVPTGPCDSNYSAAGGCSCSYSSASCAPGVMPNFTHIPRYMAVIRITIVSPRGFASAHGVMSTSSEYF